MILSVVSYAIKHFLWKNSKLIKNNNLNNVFCNRIFPYYYFSQVILKIIDFA